MDSQNLNTYQGEEGENATYVAEMLEKADKLDNPSDRPEWLPEKFQSPEDLARAYSELEKKLGSRAAPEEPAEEPSEEPEEEPQDVIDDAKSSPKGSLNIEEFSQEYAENGALSDASYEALEKAGIPRAVVDQYIKGFEATQGASEQAAYELVGGQSEYQQMISWAAANLPESKIDAFNRAVNSGDSDLIQMAVQGLNAQYRDSVGREPKLVTGSTSGTSVEGFGSLAQLTRAMADPRYEKDPAYRAEIAKKLQHSSIL